MEKKTKVDVGGLPLGDSRIANSLTPEERKKMGWEKEEMTMTMTMTMMMMGRIEDEMTGKVLQPQGSFT